MNEQIPDWAMGVNCAITVCDTECRIIYMNQRARDTFAVRGGADLIGRNLMDCHNERSQAIIRHLLAEGGSNAYTIEKQGLRKFIFQTAWRLSDGRVGGLTEFSIVMPDELPHYVR
ncbi:MAG: PAS domain-containing protein [Muribaculaceae bacterium]|nr:PAS domain-containing protein [Muribaculaceae bacterium]